MSIHDVSIANKHAVITGASRGIGAAIAHALASQGARLTLVGRHIDALEALCSSLPNGPHHCVVVDIANAQQVSAAFSSARKQMGAIEILINNAGQVQTAPFVKTDEALWHNMLAVNLTGTFLCSQAALTDMLNAQSGRIINIASSAALKGYAYVSAYVAAKHGVLGMTRALALEVAKQGITVNAVCPGYTNTDIVQKGIDHIMQKTGRTSEEALAQLTASNPQGRLIEPDEIAQAVVWLCSAGAMSVTGQAISISGGEVM